MFIELTNAEIPALKNIELYVEYDWTDYNGKRYPEITHHEVSVFDEYLETWHNVSEAYEDNEAQSEKLLMLVSEYLQQHMEQAS